MVLGGLQELVQGAPLCANCIPASTAQQAENNIETQPMEEKFKK